MPRNSTSSGSHAFSRITWPDTFYASYFYDDLNRVTAITENGQDPMAGYLAAFAYDDLFRRTSMMLGNGTVTTYAYEADSALDSLTHNMTGTADDVTYAFDYNMANQVTAKGLSNQSYQWNAPFDKAETAVPNGLNQYETVSQGGLVFDLDYDGNGSLVGDGVWTYTYDVENRLTNATNGGSVNADYEYDPLGRRSKKSGTGTATTSFLMDGNEVIAEYDGAGTLLRRYIYAQAVDDRIVMCDGTLGVCGNKSYYHQNWQLSTIAMTNSTGVATDTYVYSPYGESADATGNPFRYTGRYLDAETGLYYYRARYYSTVLGRFLQTDPIGYGDQMNMYTYVANDPVNNTDPTGKCPWCIGFIAGVIVDVAIQTLVEGKSLGEVDVGSALVSGVAGATGLGLLKQVGNVVKAVKGVKRAQKAVQRAQRFTKNKKAQGSKRKTRNAKFREGKAREGLDKAVGEAVETGVRGVAAVGGLKLIKDALPEVTVDDVASGVKDAVDSVQNAVGEMVSGCTTGDECPQGR